MLGDFVVTIGLGDIYDTCELFNRNQRFRQMGGWGKADGVYFGNHQGRDSDQGDTILIFGND